MATTTTGARRKGKAGEPYVSPVAAAPDPANVNENLIGYYKIIRDDDNRMSFKGFDKFEAWKKRTLLKIVRKAAAKGWDDKKMARMSGVTVQTCKRAIALESRLIRADTIWRLGVTCGLDMDNLR